MSCTCCSLIFFFAGLVVLLDSLYAILRFAIKQIVSARSHINKYGKDSWVVVTGATDGIGKQLCFDFAEKGFKIVLVSRSLEKLKKVAAEVESKHKVQTKTIVFDFE